MTQAEKYQPIITPITNVEDGELAETNWITGKPEQESRYCTICRKVIEAYPYYKVSIPIYVGDAYFTDRDGEVCSPECLREVKTEQDDDDEVNTDAMPGSAEGRGWIYAFYDNKTYPRDTARSGKWLLFVPHNDVDVTWTALKKALNEAKFGRSMKVAQQPSKDKYWGDLRHVICIYTYDYNDVQDVRRVRQNLRDLGFVRKISYKADETTRQLKYAKSGERVSTYYE